MNINDLHGRLTNEVFPNLKEVVEEFSKADYSEFIKIISSNDIKDMSETKRIIGLKGNKILIVESGNLILACTKKELQTAMGI